MRSDTQKSVSDMASQGVELKPCNPSVCVGGAQPTSCYCPTTQKKS